ncbi:MAG: penicillin-binding transpeptidase domain-containing protein [Anaerolineales bacterium]|jgi:penicillin-binding protein 2|nr:penicillin-binding transpeptidase domain-containing protein [Anaerolineales bacterium]
MKRSWIISTLLLIALLGGCANPDPNPANPQPGQTESELPTPVVRVTSAPDPLSALQIFIKAWQASDYPAMYALISSQSQANISEEDFTKRYRDTMNEMALKELSYSVRATTRNTDNAQLNTSVTYLSSVVGEIERDLTFEVVFENGGWKIKWEEALILPELRGGNTLSMDYETVARGNIYDRNGNILVEQTEAVALYVVPSELLPEQESRMLTELAMLTGLHRDVIRNRYAFAGGDWWVPVGEASLANINRQIGSLRAINGLKLVDYTSRFYDKNGIASHAIGYTAAIQAEELDDFLRAGYPRNALIGRSGIERWGEDDLAGKAGGTLYVVSPEGSVLSFIAKADAQPASSIQLTIDSNLQIQVQQALGDFVGAIVVMERDTGRILAMASSPEFDSNLFNPQNPNTPYGITSILNDVDQPLFNRATQGKYPLGSVFKIITMAAALESGVWTPESMYNCEYEWTELAGRTLTDWTYEKCVNQMRELGTETCDYRPSGELSLVGGLMRSCNPWFYHLGYELYRQGRVDAVSDMARGFGLGSLTGIEQIDEEPGQIVNSPVPNGEVEAVNQSIGQGEMQVTPLQVATFIAALGNGGTLYRPQLVEKIIAANGVETILFKPEARGTLPISEATLAAIRLGMREVINNPRGTAHNRFYNFRTPVYGKTGTAQTGAIPHSWFAGYTELLNDDQQNIAIAVIAENQGEGSEYAAPIFRRVAEIYIAGRPQARYWWESQIGIVSTPTPFGGIPTDAPENDD